jgi:uncharacterized protein (DUF1501 family)
MRRRDFLLLTALSPLSAAWAAPAFGRAFGTGTCAEARTLVLIELKGGNDGLNTLVPYGDPAYYRLRPKLAIPADQVLRLDEHLGMHPALRALLAAWHDGDLAWVQGLGYPNPSLSHFRSADIWQTASGAQQELAVGWLAQSLPGCDQRPGPDVLILGGDDGVARGGTLRVITFTTAKSFVQQARQLPVHHPSKPSTDALGHIVAVRGSIQQNAARLQTQLDSLSKPPAGFPNTALGRQLREAAQMLAAGIQVPVIKLTMGGFDTHRNQPRQHEQLLKQLADGLAHFRQAMIDADRWDRVLLLTYSEFGRRAAENKSLGTDHGTAAPHLVLGGSVRGGLYGQAPTLTALDRGNLHYSVDYRQLYATIAQRWWQSTTAGWAARFSPMNWL